MTGSFGNYETMTTTFNNINIEIVNI